MRRFRQYGLGVPAVDVEAREARLRAQVLIPTPAEAASAARRVQPGDSDAIPHRPIARPIADGVDRANDLVAGDNRIGRRGDLALDDVQVGVAHAAREHPETQLPGSRRRYVAGGKLQGPALDRRRLGKEQAAHGGESTGAAVGRPRSCYSLPVGLPAMKSSVNCRATSSLYCLGGVFMK